MLQNMVVTIEFKIVGNCFGFRVVNHCRLTFIVINIHIYFSGKFQLWIRNKHILICIISKQNEIRHKLLQHYIKSSLYNLQHTLRWQQHKYRYFIINIIITTENRYVESNHNAKTCLCQSKRWACLILSWTAQKVSTFCSSLK